MTGKVFRTHSWSFSACSMNPRIQYPYIGIPESACSMHAKTCGMQHGHRVTVARGALKRRSVHLPSSATCAPPAATQPQSQDRLKQQNGLGPTHTHPSRSQLRTCHAHRLPQHNAPFLDKCASTHARTQTRAHARTHERTHARNPQHPAGSPSASPPQCLHPGNYHRRSQPVPLSCSDCRHPTHSPR